MEWIIALLIGIVIGAGILLLILKLTSKKALLSAQQQAEKILKDAKEEIESLKREQLIEAREELLEQRQNLERELRKKQEKLQEYEKELDRRELEVDRKAEYITKKEKDIQEWEKRLSRKESYISEKTEQLNQLIAQEIQKLEEISGLTREEAKQLLLKDMEEEAQEEGRRLTHSILDQAKLEAQRKAREIIVQAIQQIAAEQSVEATVSVVQLPNDDMKGRIIGREGRNIRAFELETGVDVIIDDTPEIVVLSSFNSYRREIAKRSLEKLIADGRIHPARIEEVVEKTRQEMKESLHDIGEQTLLEVGVHGVAPELIEILGRLQYRTSYGQNVLNHSVEVAHLCGIMAAELGLDVQLAKRAGIFHDIGKALDNYSETDHATLGSELLKKFNENPVVINAARAHHAENDADSPYTILVAAADVLSGSRPGARRETLENFLQRMKQLEEIARSFEGVENAFAIQAGREVRVIVETEKIDDVQAKEMARQIAKRIKEEMEFASQIRVTVIREYRAYDYAT